MTQPKIDHTEATHDYSITQATIDGQVFTAFTVKKGDVQEWDVQAGNRGPSGQLNERAEVAYAAAPTAQKVKSTYNVTDKTGKQTYDIDLRVKAGWPPHEGSRHEWATWLQFHSRDDLPSGTFRGFNGVSVHGMDITLEVPGKEGVYLAREPVPVEKTIRRRLVVNWTSKADGYVKWVDRATGRVIGRYDGPTIAAGEWKYLKQGYYRAGGLPDGTVYQSSPGGPLMDISPGDLSEQAQPPVEPPVQPPAADVVDPKKAQAGLQALVDTRLQLEKVTLPMLDAEITELQKRRTELQASRDRIAAALDVGDWGGGVVAK